jgi:WD40 repeat protein
MHTARINRIGVDATCTLLATASDDKTVRLWRLPRGDPLNTLRPPIGPGDDGKISAVAVAPNGSWVAAGGWDAQWTASKEVFVYIFQSATGAVLTRLGPLPDRIRDLVIGRNVGLSKNTVMEIVRRRYHSMRGTSFLGQ